MYFFVDCFLESPQPHTSVLSKYCTVNHLDHLYHPMFKFYSAFSGGEKKLQESKYYFTPGHNLLWLQQRLSPSGEEHSSHISYCTADLKHSGPAAGENKGKAKPQKKKKNVQKTFLGN